jgi:6-phosphogluconolactonase
MNRNDISREQIHSKDQPELAAAALVQDLLSTTHHAIEQRGRAVWAVSGGSSILQIYRELQNRLDQWKKAAHSMTVVWVDERHVIHSSNRSNYGNASRKFWSSIEGVTLLPVPYFKDVKTSAAQYQEDLKKKKITRGSIDAVILGMGTDGHVASLFPGHEKLKETKSDVVSLHYDKVDEARVTLTYPILNQSRNRFLYLTGHEKGETFRNALKSGDLSEFPVCGIEHRNLHIFTDQQVI